MSPFAADSARKGAPKAESSGDTAGFADRHALSAVEGSVRATHPAPFSGTSANLVIMGSAAPVVEEISSTPDPQSSERPEVKANVKAEARTEARAEVNIESLRDAVLHALSNQQMLVSLLETAKWTLEGNTLIAKVAASSTMIEMSFTNEARRTATAAASGLAGRPIKILVEPGGSPQAASAERRASSKSSGSARSRAEQDPVVQRMQEKFGAEIRTVIDYREKG